MTGGVKNVMGEGMDASVTVRINHHATQTGGIAPGIALGEALGGTRVHNLLPVLTEERACHAFLTLPWNC